MQSLFNAVTRVSTMWSLAAFAIAALVYLISKYVTLKGGQGSKGKFPAAALSAIIAIVLLGLIPVIASLYVELHKPDPIVRLRVTVLDPQNTPVEDATVWSSIGGEPKKVSGGWEFDIPASTEPVDRELTVYAAKQEAHLKGESPVHLSSDRNPPVKICLYHDTSARVRGIVTAFGKTLSGVRVTVAGYGDEAVVTKVDGGFVLPAHAAVGEQVQLHAEKKGYSPVWLGHPAGDAPANLMMDHK